MSHPFYKRLLKEHRLLSTTNLPGISLLNANKNLTEYNVSMQFDNHPVYSNDRYQLLIVIDKDYPVQPPKVKFVANEGMSIPIHPHIYSNGHICLNLLGDDWSPASSIESIILSLQSMLNNNEVKERPQGDEAYSKWAPTFANKSTFVYDDDNI